MNMRKNSLPSWSAFQSSLRSLNFSYLQKWTIFGIMIGIICGASAVGLSVLTSFFTGLFLGSGAGFIPPSSGGQQAPYAFIVERPWMLPMIAGAGGLAVGLLLYRFAPRTEEEGHGTDAVIDAFHNKEGNIRGREPVLTGIASPLTLGSGGSGGMEGPMSQIGAGISSVLAKAFKFDADDRRIAVAAGLAAGIGSIFKVPLGAALFSTEVFYRRDFEVKVIVPSVIASVVGYTVFGLVFGWAPIFSISQDSAKYIRPESLLLYGAIGVICAAASMAYVRSFYFASRAFANLKQVPAYVKPAIGGAAVGAIAVVAPQVMGTSYGWLQLAMLKSPLLMPIWIILAIAVLKIVATSLTIGSGGSAGVFAPTMAIGGLLGAFIGGLFHALGLFLWVDVSATAIVGMVAFFSATTKTPISTIVMGSELTSGYGLLAPMMIATVVAYAASGLNSSIFKSQVTSRRESPVHRGEYDISILRALTANDAASPQFLIMSHVSPVKEVLGMMKSNGVDFVFVSDSEHAATDDDRNNDGYGAYGKEKTRVVSLHEVVAAQDTGRSILAEVHSKEVPIINNSSSLYDAFNLVVSAGSEVIAVSSGGKIAGMISYKEIAKAYHQKVHSKNPASE